MQKIKIIFIGTPDFGAIILEQLIKDGYPPILVITSPNKKVGRKQVLLPSPVKIIAQKYKIPIGKQKEIEKLKPDLGIVASFGQIISQKILDIPKYGFINVHPSFLPKYRGATPVQAAILNGDKETGVTIMKMTERIDAGPIIGSEKLKMQSEKLNYQELHDQLANLGAKLLIKIIPRWVKGEIKPIPQDESKATYTKILKKEDGKIDWRKPAEVLEREVRAFYPWPGSYTIWQNKNKLKKIKVLKARVFLSPEKTKYQIGKVLVVPQNEIGVQCKKDFLAIEKLQPEGKKAITAEDFLRGHTDFIGAILIQ